MSDALRTGRVAESSAVVRLLRSPLLPVISSILREHLGAPGTKLLAADLYELVDADLESLRDHFTLPNTAKAYCDDWRKAGFLIRRPAADVRSETFELSPDATVALRIIDQLDVPRSAVTESRLVNLAGALRRLAIDTDPNSDRRIEALQQDGAEIEAQIARIRSGDIEVLDPRRALERIEDVVQQAADLPGDFGRVRTRFEELNRELRAEILESDAAQRTILDDIFRGVDHIESSDDGRTFAAFAALLRDPEQADALESDISAILDRDFASALDLSTRRFLRTFTGTLKGASRDVQRVLTDFARGLRRYVQSQEYQRDRALKTALQQALAGALTASPNIRPYVETDVAIELSTVPMSSVGELAPHDPSDFDIGPELVEFESGITDIELLRRIARESEIDFRELTDAVNALIETNGVVSIGEVLAERPATQGLASVVGLLSLAGRDGSTTGDTEELSWDGTDGVHRVAWVDRYLFSERIEG